MDFGRKAYLDLMGSKDPAIKRLIEDGYEFVTNAFKSESKPAGIRVKDARTVASQLTQQGFLTELCSAFNEVGDSIPAMESVWRKPRASPSM